LCPEDRAEEKSGKERKGKIKVWRGETYTEHKREKRERKKGRWNKRGYE